MLFHTRDLLVRQRTQTINALRGHLAEFGVVAPQGPAHVDRLASALQGPGSGLPGSVRELGALLLDRIEDLDAKIDGLRRELRARACQDDEAARLMTIPGIGPITATAVQAFAPPMESFRRGRDFAAWLGLVPRQYTTGGKPRLGRISKMGQRDLRRLLITGAMAVVSWAARRGETNDPWLARMLARKPRNAGRGGAGQPDGTHHLGGDDEEGGLPGSRRHLRGRRKAESRRGCGQVGGQVRANGRSRRDRENQSWYTELSSPQK